MKPLYKSGTHPLGVKDQASRVLMGPGERRVYRTQCPLR